MVRMARIKSESGIYHVIVRGINRQDIFQDDEDKGVYLDRLTQYKTECDVELYAYCLMSNHVHLLVKEGKKPLEEFMKRIGISYSYRYNHKYDRIGHLFQDRFKSEPIDDDAYFLTVFRYIHQNPKKAGLVPFHWTSYDDYANREGITDTDFVLSLFSSKEDMIRFLEEEADEKCMEYEGQRKLTDERAAEIICEVGKVKHCQALQEVERKERNRTIQNLKSAGLSIRQIERLTGISRGIIARL